MASELVGLLGVVLLLVLLLVRVPVAISMIIVGVAGYAFLVSPNAALTRFAQDAFNDGATFELTVVPMFVLMGLVLTHSGLSADLFKALNHFLWRFRGGLSGATIAASALFGAVSGSSIAGATTMSLVATPQMRKAGYHAGFAGATTAAGSTLGAIIPPSALLVLYALLAEVSVGAVLTAAFLPGLITTALLMITAYIVVRRRPDFAPPAKAPEDLSTMGALAKIWPVPVIFGLTMGGLYAGWFTATESAGIGAILAFAYAALTRRLSLDAIKSSVSRTVRISAMVFLLLIAGRIFGYFLSVSRLPSILGDFVTSLAVPSLVILIGLFVIYFVLGALMDETAILVIMTPIALPAVMALGYDPIWFGVVTALMLLTGLITPPVGMLVFVVNGVTGIPLTQLFKGILPYVVALSIGVLLLLVFPQLALWPVEVLR